MEIVYKYMSVFLGGGSISFGATGIRLGGGVKAKMNATDFHSKSSISETKGRGGGKSIHFMKALFNTYSKINVWWMLLSR